MNVRLINSFRAPLCLKTFSDCVWVNHEIWLISVRALKDFRLVSPSVGEGGGTFDRAIKICLPNTERFICYTKILPRAYDLCNMPSLVYAEIYREEFIPVLTVEERRDSVSMPFEGLHNVKALSIAADILEVLPHEDLEIELPIFHNLIDLKIVRNCDGRDILSLFRIMPNLQHLSCDQASH